MSGETVFARGGEKGGTKSVYRMSGVRTGQIAAPGSGPTARVVRVGKRESGVRTDGGSLEAKRSFAEVRSQTELGTERKNTADRSGSAVAPNPNRHHGLEVFLQNVVTLGARRLTRSGRAHSCSRPVCPGHAFALPFATRSKRSRFITLFQAATKSRMK